MSGQQQVAMKLRQFVEPAPVSPDPDGNRAQRRAWKKLTKNKGSDAR